MLNLRRCFSNIYTHDTHKKLWGGYHYPVGARVQITSCNKLLILDKFCSFHEIWLGPIFFTKK